MQVCTVNIFGRIFFPNIEISFYLVALEICFSSGSGPVYELGRTLVNAAAEPYFKILVRWIHRGCIDDPGKDFFVEDHEVLERSSLPLEYSDDYWERRYAIKADQVFFLLFLSQVASANCIHLNWKGHGCNDGDRHCACH
jgi:hypothetical protein